MFQFCCTAVLGKGNKIDKQIKKGEKSFNKNIFERLWWMKLWLKRLCCKGEIIIIMAIFLSIFIFNTFPSLFVWLQKYSYPPHGRDIIWRPLYPWENSSLALYFSFNFLTIETPSPPPLFFPQISNPFCGGWGGGYRYILESSTHWQLYLAMDSHLLIQDTLQLWVKTWNNANR